ncbi:gamma-glutamyl-hercynylcysteine sulfoxide hydrolase [Longimycelium tulufanense]|uniref:Gamma-glutamyl-hercynylcysteine sulfoxide hydrolase n=1 Tax=Longimycelium tulufanense TaxID=907463 RepID=A0A8J3FV96_9PSEU|nr:gamma-glutamyl-hercynylcysteine sulfoxide hydrolase [Longimycelium tulufanense]
MRQSWAPGDMRGGGTVNADGFGVGWYPPDGREPVRYRVDRPMWSDVNFAALAEVTRSPAVLASVRSATIGMPVVETAAAPFSDDGWLFAHNGVVRGWPESVAHLAGEVPVANLLTMDAPMDSALLWVLLRHRLRKGADPAEAVTSLVADVAEASPMSRLNLLLTDSEQIVATTWTHSLWTRVGPGRVEVSSEPGDDDPAWTEVPDRHLVLARPSEVDLRPLAEAAGGPTTGAR